MSKKKGTGINVGSISILFIFVLLCLTAFSTLSLVSANADSKLTNTAAVAMTEFYAADSDAEELLAKIDGVLKKITVTDNKEDYFKACQNAISKNKDSIVTPNTTLLNTENTVDALAIKYSVKISDTNEIQVDLDIPFPISLQPEDKRYKLVKWQAVNTIEWVGDDSISVWDGN